MNQNQYVPTDLLDFFLNGLKLFLKQIPLYCSQKNLQQVCMFQIKIILCHRSNVTLIILTEKAGIFTPLPHSSEHLLWFFPEG